MLAISGLRGLASAAILSGVMNHAGGWAVITLDNVPDYAVAGKPIELTYTVRQHGHTLLDDLHGTIEARSGRTAVDASARCHVLLVVVSTTAPAVWPPPARLSVRQENDGSSAPPQLPKMDDQAACRTR